MKEEDVTGMREFAPSLLEPFGLKARKVTRAYGAFICETSQGLKIVKKTTASAGQLWFAHGAKEYLAGAGFGNTDRFRLTETGEPFACAGSECYTVRDWLAGEEPELKERAQNLKIAEELGRMSCRSEGYRAPELCRAVSRYHELPEQLHKQSRQLERYGKSLRKNGRYTEFDLMLLDCLPIHIEQAREAEQILSAPAYAEEAERLERDLVFSHGSFSDHTVQWGQGAMLITDFEEACYRMPVLDLAGFMEKVLRKNSWETSLGIGLAAAYERYCHINAVQRRILYAALLFPGRLAQLCYEVYSVRRSWIPLSYGRKLEEIRAQQEERRRFLEDFRREWL